MTAPTYLRGFKLDRPPIRFELIRYDHSYPKPTQRPRRTVWQFRVIWDRRGAA